jgi:MFS family permease
MCVGITVLYLAMHLGLFPNSAGDPVPQLATQEGKAKRSWRDHPLANPRFLFFIFILLGVRTLFAHQWLTMPDYVTRAYPASIGARFEWINGLNPLIIVVFTPLVAALTRRVHVLTMMIVGTTVSSLATFLLVPGPQLFALLTYVIIFSLGEALWSSRFLEFIADIAPPSQVGLFMGVATIPWFLAKFTTGFYSGAMLEHFVPATGPQDSSTLWLVYALIALSSPIGLIIGRSWLRKDMGVDRASSAGNQSNAQAA